MSDPLCSNRHFIADCRELNTKGKGKKSTFKNKAKKSLMATLEDIMNYLMMKKLKKQIWHSWPHDHQIMKVTQNQTLMILKR